MDFKLVSQFKMIPDQKKAVSSIVKNLKNNVKYQILLGVTGSGKTFDMANIIYKIKKPTLIITFNKLLAAQLYQEFKEFFPENAVHYFVSYYDYYQPEAYIPQTDTYIEKDAKINEEIDRLRHATVQDLLSRKDVIAVASVSCIYNLGSPQTYQNVSLEIKEGKTIKRSEFLRYLVSLGYQRNDFNFLPSSFRVRENKIDIFLVTGKEILSIEFLEEKIKNIFLSSPHFTISNKRRVKNFEIFPAHFWITPQEKLKIAIENIKLELEERIKELKKQKKFLEIERLQQRTNYDLAMLEETGYCHGIENYSRHLEFRNPGDPPFTLLDYFSYPNINSYNPISLNRFLVFIDESHMTLPQLHAMANQDRKRKETLIEYGFRLPSAIDNRPLTFEEFIKKTDQIVFVSATPAKEEKELVLKQSSNKNSKKFIIEQLIRPTNLLEPTIEIKPIKNQLKDLIEKIKERKKENQRVLVLTLTKRLAEILSKTLSENGISCQWLHSEIKTLKRPEILKELREGKYDVLVGINLLREGLDLPEVSLIAILDADKEGFLRSETTLIQIMGRAARHPEGHVILYADNITKSMKNAIKEIERRRKIQMEYNKKHKLLPKPIIKPIREWAFSKTQEEKIEPWLLKDKKLLEKELKGAIENWDFERAIKLRDLIKKINHVEKK
ncbi:MAG: excinuclease ABC subunit UvrB [Minisyncoccia bacterium]